MITTDNTVYKYKKNVIPSVKTMNSVQKTPSHSSNNKNTVKYTTKRTIKQQPNQRISMTAPPSVKNHSLVNSRSVSAASSTSNLKSIHLSNESNIEPLHSIIPKSTNPKQISAESICAALAKQERSLRYNPSHYLTTHATTASHSKLINNNSNIGNYVKSKSGIRSLSTSSRIHHSTERSIPKSQQTKQSYPLHGSNNCIPVALSCNNYTADLNIKTPDTILPAESFGSGQMITIASKNDDINVDVPKPIRGKRKSLIGRKISSSTVTDTSAVGIPVAVKPISAVRPTLHSSNNSENIKTQILMVDKTKVTTTDTSIKLNITDKDDGNLSPKHIDGYTKCDSTKNNYNYNKSILDKNDVDIDKDKLTSPGMWIIREDLGVITDDFS
uniref:SJCHGC06571 protein n=1 Tax=Schistosoma japonicum TaxID=6182 RepID=Q5D8U5_SCHJA|nr:SJCHGC06571 protein [Schistosoma japonicum]